MTRTRFDLLAFGDVDTSDTLLDEGEGLNPSPRNARTVRPCTSPGLDEVAVTIRGLLNWGRVLGLVVTVGISSSFWFFVVS